MLLRTELFSQKQLQAKGITGLRINHSIYLPLFLWAIMLLMVCCKAKIPARKLIEIPVIENFHLDNNVKQDTYLMNLKGKIKSRLHYKIDPKTNTRTFDKAEWFTPTGYLLAYQYPDRNKYYFSYNSSDKLMKRLIIDDSGDTTNFSSYHYTSSGVLDSEIVYADSSIIKYEYDQNKNLIKFTSVSFQGKYQYHEINNYVRNSVETSFFKDYFGKDTAYKTIKKIYDNRNQVIRSEINDRGMKIIYDYTFDSMGNLVRETQFEYEKAVTEWNHKYDSYNNRIESTFCNLGGCTETYKYILSYDNHNNIITEAEYFNDTLKAKWEYDYEYYE